ncbi:hypothetical protein IWX79_004333 [Janthinobacterium sp. CAN_S1]
MLPLILLCVNYYFHVATMCEATPYKYSCAKHNN